MKREMTGLELRQGAWYALEQAGRLLESATLVFNNGDSATGLGLAMFAAEELGRSRILRDLADRADAGEKIYPQTVQEACEDHVEKQRKGMFSISFHTDRDTGLGKVMLKQEASAIGSDEWAEAERQLQNATESMKKQLPHSRHNLRMRAFYVGLRDSGDWGRPDAVNREVARTAITDVVNDYAPERDRLQPTLAQQHFPEMLQALERMSPQPLLPLPRWPNHGIEQSGNTTPNAPDVPLLDRITKKALPFLVIVILILIALLLYRSS
jgi:AbiV family abortive infection protein